MDGRGDACAAGSRSCRWSSASATVAAVDGIDLDIPGGEFFTMLGPSGCGKTTTLRLIAGLRAARRAARSGSTASTCRATPPHKRRVNTVFQSYALFPHMTVAENVAFGLRYQKRRRKAEPRGGSARRWRWCSSAGFDARRPTQLSGGQQQRVALARALVLEPPRAAARRAARRARRPAAHGPAGRAEAHPGGARHHVRLRHPRPGRGAHDERPRRGHARRQGRAVRRAAGGLRGARRPRSWRTSSAPRTCSAATPAATARSASASSRCTAGRARPTRRASCTR